jgi:hypothetical protein
MLDFIAPSPDGKWLAWLDFHGKKPRLMAATLDASRKRVWPEAQATSEGGVGSPVWTSDSRAIVDVRATYRLGGPVPIMIAEHAFIRGIEASAPTRDVRLPGITDCLPMGITHEGRLLLVDRRPRAGPGIASALVDATLGGPRAAIRKLSVPLPGAWTYSAGVLSPRGNRIAWVMAVTDPLPGIMRWNLLAGLFGVESKSHVGIWVTDLRGQVFRCVGVLPPAAVKEPLSIANFTPTDARDWPSGLRWLPDGKQLSFFYKNALYTVPVE